MSFLAPIIVALATAAHLPLTAETLDAKRIVFVAGGPSHGKGSHEHRAGCMLLADHVTRGMPGYRATVVTRGWPEDESVFEGAHAVVFFCDGGGRHVAMKHLAKVDALAKKGVGIGCIHYGVEVPKDKAGAHFLKWIGGFFETHWSVNPTWTAKITALPRHPVARGVKPFTLRDEWYFHMRFREDMRGVVPILSAVAPESTMKRKDGPHSGNPHVRKEVAAGTPQHLAWVATRADGGRGFGFTGAHFHANWRQDDFRRVVLNALVWIAGGEVPPKGVPSPTPTDVEMRKNQDYHGRLGARVFHYPRKQRSTDDKGGK